AATSPYANPLIFLFLGGFLIALGIERWGLHRRMALAIVAAFGTRPRRIVAGFMAATAFLSMWISNTATAMLMLPIAQSVIETVAPGRPAGAEAGEAGEAASGRGGGFAVALLLAIAYAASIGGMGTLIGSPPNALAAGFLRETRGVEVSFLGWMAVAMPVAVLGLAASYLLLARVVFRLGDAEAPGGAAFVREELRSLGPMGPQEKAVAAVFALTAALWIGRPLVARVLPGVSDTGIALFGGLLLFVIPSSWRRGEYLLAWADAKRLPWGVLLLFGGGLSLAAAVESSGLAAWIGGRLEGLGGLSPVWVVLAVVGTVILLTELTSNTATTATFLPVVAAVAIGLGVEPLLLVLPMTLAASCAFMLPVATAPNAIVYGSGRVTIPQMARAGIWLNALFVALLTLAALTVVPWML
ncbi:MAG TPA: DASS family sodium-coupled anion symporter, partial [Thermoanaerobaculia bacterium]|nr:DASS family sodium-coupled anion symporter [Thermoanaerobaculia bacterium]